MNDLKQILLTQIDSIKSRLVEISDTIGEYAEPGFQEYKTSQLLVSELEKHGFEIQKPVADLPTAFRAIFQAKSGGPVIAFCAELDALPPPLGHICGHNIISTAATGCAIALSKIIYDFKGSVVVMGTPAEEGGAPPNDWGCGKALMVEKGAFDGIDIAMMVHPSVNEKWWFNRTCNEARFYWVDFIGKPSMHGAMYDYASALDAAVLFIHAINILKQNISSEARIQYVFMEGGKTPNVIPFDARIKVFIRAGNENHMDYVEQKVKKCAEGCATALGLASKFEKYGSARSIVQNLTLEEIFNKNLKEIGIDAELGAGEKRILRKEYHGPHFTDFGDVSRKMPGLHASIGFGHTWVSHHPETARIAVSERAHKGLLTATKAMAMTAYDLFNDPELVEKARKEYDKYKAEGFSNLPSWHMG